MIFLIKFLFCFIPKLSFKFIENITQCTEKLKRTFLAFQFRYLLIWHKNRRCDATCIFDECTDKELFFYLAAQNHLKVFKNKNRICQKKEPSQKKIEIKPIFIGVNTKNFSQKYYKKYFIVTEKCFKQSQSTLSNRWENHSLGNEKMLWTDNGQLLSISNSLWVSVWEILFSCTIIKKIY